MSLTKLQRDHKKALKRRNKVKTQTKEYQVQVLKSVLGEVKAHPDKVIGLSKERSLRGKLLHAYLTKRTRRGKK
jgi:hypothetical protein